MLRKTLALLLLFASGSITQATQRGGPGSAGSHSRPARPAQHQPPGQPDRPRQPQHSQEPRHPRDDRRRDGRQFDRNTHHRVDRRDSRYHFGHREIFFEGYWFGCATWPEWVFTEDIYILEIGPNIYMIYVYNNPGAAIQVYLVN